MATKYESQNFNVLMFACIPEAYLRIVLIQILIYLAYGQSEGHCIWYGECYSGFRNCHYNGTAQLLNDTGAEDIMLELCPHIYKSSK